MLHDFLSLSLLDRCLSGRKHNGLSATTIGACPWFPVDVFLSGTEYWTGPGPFNRTGKEDGTNPCDDAGYLTSAMQGSLNFATHSGTLGDATKQSNKGERKKRGTARARLASAHL